MPEFSLIVATKDRVSDLARLFASLDAQTYSDYEVILVDQNEDDRLAAVIAGSRRREKILHLRSPAGVSLARNVGIEHASGKILAFPDDDCWYPPDLLQQVSGWFNANTPYDILSVASLDAEGNRTGNGWFQSSCDLSHWNVYRTSIGYGYFVRAGGAMRGVRYDEGIGPGANTPYLGGEDTDYILAGMSSGARGRYEAQWHVLHPRKDIRNASVSKDRVYIYGKGMGHVQRKHHLTWLWAAFMAYDFGRAACFCLLGTRPQGTLWYWHGRGLLNGFSGTRRR
ncbi:MAG: glycosyltransferase family 2 protein [Acidobacteriaceae bacterium]